MKQLIKLVAVTLGCAVLVGIATYWYLATPPEAGESRVTFSDERLGLTFTYPESFGTAEIAFIEPGGTRPSGESGVKFVGTFSALPTLEFGGITDDFAAGRGGLLTDTRGYSFTNETYVFRFVGAKPDIEVIPFKVLEREFGEILILDDRSFAADRDRVEGPALGVGEGRYAALVNLSGPEFPGVVFYNWDPTALPLDEFEALLMTVTVE